MSKETKKSNARPQDISRRTAAKKVLIGGGIIGATVAQDKWVKPVVDSALLPVHAEPSIPFCE